MKRLTALASMLLMALAFALVIGQNADRSPAAMVVAATVIAVAIGACVSMALLYVFGGKRTVVNNYYDHRSINLVTQTDSERVRAGRQQWPQIDATSREIMQ